METTGSKNLKIISNVLLISFIFALIYFSSDIIFPLVLAFLIAVMVRPIDNFLQTWMKFPRILSITTTILLVSGIFAALVLFMVFQVSEFMSDIPHIKASLTKHVIRFDEWTLQKIGFKLLDMEALQKSSTEKMNSVPMEYVDSVSNALMYMVLVPIYVFLILMYRSLLLTFLLKLVPKNQLQELQEVVNDIKSIIRNYIIGLLIEVLVVACMTSVGLWLVGVKYFIFLGVLTALLNLIPYIGIIIAFFISAVLALINTVHFEIVFWVLIVNVIVQFIDNNILMPRIVGSKVSINALASMVSVIVGGALAGMPGMFLAIPIVAIIKVVFDKIPYLQPYGYLLGDDIPKSFNWQKIRIPYFSGKE